MRRTAFSLCLGALLLSAFMASCSDEAERLEARDAKAHEIRREYHEGPFYVRLTADKDSMSIAESLVLSLEAESESGFQAELPDFGEKMGELSVRECREDQPQLTREGKIVSKKRCVLEPFLSGDYAVPSMRVRFRKDIQSGVGSGASSHAGNSQEHDIATEEIVIKVYSLLEKENKEPSLNPIRGPVELRAEPPSLLVVLSCLLAAGFIAGGVLFLIKRKRAAAALEAARALPAHELAFMRLQEIFDEKLLERGELKLFFSRISDVLRSYIENRFGVHAPKRTTEELLSDISRDPSFSVSSKELLIDFLQGCDLVKFAEHQPSPEEIAKAVDSCKAFIEITKAPPIDEQSGKE